MNENLKGDSILKSSLDDTQAGTDLLHSTSILPSILPNAMTSIESNDAHQVSQMFVLKNNGQQSYKELPYREAQKSRLSLQG